MDLNKKNRKLVRRKSNSYTNFSQENLIQEPKLQRKSANIQEFGTQNNQSIVNKNILIFVLIIVIVICFCSIINSINKSSPSSSTPSNYNSSYSSSNYTYSSTSSTSNSNDTNVIDLSDDYTEVTLDKDVLKQLGYEITIDGNEGAWNQFASLKKDGENVVSLDIPCFYEKFGIKYKITNIERGLFWGCKDLEYIIIPESVTKIGDGAFRGCSSLESVSLTNSLTEIGKNVFANCTGLKNFVIPSNVTKIEDGTFFNCAKFKNIVIPDGVKEIGKSAFSGCFDLENVVISDSVTHIGESAFCACESLKTINIPESVTYIGRNVFDECKSLENLRIPESVKYIGESAFKNISIVYYNGNAGGTPWGAKKVISNKKTSSINKTSSFAQPPNLDQKIKYIEVVLDKKVLYQLGYNPADKKKFTSVKIPYTYKFKGKNYKITKIGEKAFYNYASLQKVIIEEGIQILGVSSFENCIGLTTVKLPNTINKINNNAFANCKALKTINLPDGLTELRDSLFYNCLSLSNIEIPSSVTSIGDMVFYKCKSLKKISLSKNLISIGTSAFAGCRGLEDLEIPNSVRRIGQWAFSNCVSVSYLTVPDDVNSIGEEAFANVGYVYYDGNASGQPWGALDSNKIPVVPYTLDELYLSSNNIEKFIGYPIDVINKQFVLYYQNATSKTVELEVKYFKNSIKSISDHYIISYARNGLKTAKGIQVGDSENELIEAYENLRSGKNGMYCFNYEIRNNGSRFPTVVGIDFQVKNGRIFKIMVSDGGENAWEGYCAVLKSEFDIK